MRKRWYIVLPVLVMGSMGAWAEGVCEIPKDCNFLGSEFSTGGGDKTFYIMEVVCEVNGQIIKYVDVEGSIGGFFKLGRVTMPRKIVFKKVRDDGIECDY